MSNLNDIIQAAQGGQGINNLAQQFGLSPEQAQAAINAIIPGLSAGLQKQAGSLDGLGSLINSLNQGVHQQTYTAPQGVPPGAGSSALGQIFGNSQILNQIIQQAAAASGVNAAVLQQMLPVLVSMVLGGMFHSMANQGLSGILGQLANAVNQGGLGSAVGPMPGAAAPAGAAGGGSILANILGSMFGGRTAPASTTATPQSQAIQAGLEALTKMMQPGIQVAQAHQQIVQNIFGQTGRPS
jgi:hypothetical protein